jgi:hypothetical protein
MIKNENQGGSVAVALVSNTGESTKEARRLFGQKLNTFGGGRSPTYGVRPR